MLDLDRQLREFGSFVDEAVEPVRAAEITDRPTVPVAYPWRRHVALAGAAAAVVLLIIAAIVLLDPFGSEAPFIEEPTTVPTTTTIATPATEASETTVALSTTQAPTSAPPVITWTRIDDPAVFGGPYHETMTAVTSGPAGLIAVGPDWVEPVSTDAALWTSTDGTVWSRFSDDQAVFGGAGFQYPTAIAAGSENIVISGYDCDDGVSWAVGCRGAVWASEDTVTWQRVGTDGDVFEGEGIVRVLDVIATENGFVAVGSAVWTSSDGRSWERVFDLEPTTGDNSPGEVMWSIVQTGDGYVAAGQRGFQAAVWTSSDGQAWSAVEDEGQFGPPLVPNEQLSEFSFWRINDLLDSSDAILAMGSGTGAQPDSPIVWRSTDGADWEQTVIDRFSAHRSETMNTAIRTDDDWILAAGTHNAVRHEHSAILLWVSNDDGRTWSVLPSEGDVLGNYLSDLYRSDVLDMILWNDRIVMVGARGTGRVEASDIVNVVHPTWDAAVWIGTIEE